MRSRALTCLLCALLLALGGAPASGQGSPPELAGLVVEQEQVTEREPDAERREYLDQVTLYSIRTPERELLGTLQVGLFRDDAPTDEIDFQRSIAGQVGETVPIEQRVAGETLYVTRGKKLSIVIWFRERHLMILSLREDHTTPKRIVRDALAVRP